MTIDTISDQACRTGSESLLGDLYKWAKSKRKARTATKKLQEAIDDLYSHLSRFRKVKTILQLEREVDLSTFYSPTCIDRPTYATDGDPLDKLEIADLPTLVDVAQTRRVIVRGTAGQGKSTFLRYLAATEMSRGKAIPLFCELRRIPEFGSVDDSLTDHLRRELTTYGIETTAYQWAELCNNTQISLFLDGFDELPESQRQNVIHQVEGMARRFDNMEIIVSSRPHSGLEGASAFSVVDIAYLAYEDVPRILRSYCPDTFGEILSGVEESTIKNVLSTPLMVALLAVRYNIEGNVPHNEMAFYEDLFQVLVRRHDQTKSGFRRERQTALGDTELRQVFSGVSLYAKEPSSIHSYDKLATCCKRVLRQLHHDETQVDNVLADIMSSTNLLLDDGTQFEFPHATVREYHAAAFLADQSDEVFNAFCEELRNKSLLRSWDGELRFLFQLDKGRFFRCLLAPEITKVLEEYEMAEHPEARILILHSWCCPQVVVHLNGPTRRKSYLRGGSPWLWGGTFSQHELTDDTTDNPPFDDPLKVVATVDGEALDSVSNEIVERLRARQGEISEYLAVEEEATASVLRVFDA